MAASINLHESMLTPDRLAKIQEMAKNRQFDLSVLLENVHDPHNIGAILRTCDAIGIREIYALYTKETPFDEEKVSFKRSSSGAIKWVDLHIYTDLQKCLLTLRKKYDKILGTHLNHEALDLYELDLTQSVVLAFGNEHRGMSKELLDELDGNFVIPQKGMVESLNISVACAITLSEAMRQRSKKGLYQRSLHDKKVAACYAEYIERSRPLTKE